MNSFTLDHRHLYRVPWNLADNAISWLEPTMQCNLACDGCYRENEKDSHKSMEQIRRELDVFARRRNSDCISIAGGDPLLHPKITSIVAEIRSRNWKPIINTNGIALTKRLLHDLKQAGAFGFTFHVDSRQGRSGKWKGKTEIELNELRYEYAAMVKDEGGVACSFNSTIYEDTLQFIADLIRWGHRNIDKVQTMVFIAFRQAVSKLPFEWYAGAESIRLNDIKYHSDHDRRVDIRSSDMVNVVRAADPEFKPLAYLNGTDGVASMKWLFTERIGTPTAIYGYMGPKFMELVMATHHFVRGAYLSYVTPDQARMGRLAMLLLWPFDAGMRRALASALRNPMALLRRAYIQTILFIQPVDFSESGGQNMCDGCPDMTAWNDEIVYSCRLEEIKRFGTLLRTVPRTNTLTGED
jgi:hypothetical protein